MMDFKAREKLKLGLYPYTYVRTVVMRSLLFKKEDYHKMLKMSFSEIAKLMQDSHYKKDIDALATSYSGADMLELAINRNAAETFKKLIRISTEELGILVREYAKRKDVEDIKTILRGKFTQTDEKSIENSLTAAGSLDRGFLADLAKKDSIEHILKSSRMLDPNELKNLVKDFEQSKSLAHIENALDKKYYSAMMKFAEILPKEGQLFKEFLLSEVEILNILTILRLNRAKFPKQAVQDAIIRTGIGPLDSKYSTLASTGSIEEFAKAFSKTEYKAIFAGGLEEYKNKDSLIKLETELYKHLLKKSTRMLHMHLLSVDVILGFMFAKEIETRNLKILIKGKQLGLSEEFIEKQMVIE